MPYLMCVGVIVSVCSHVCFSHCVSVGNLSLGHSRSVCFCLSVVLCVVQVVSQQRVCVCVTVWGSRSASPTRRDFLRVVVGHCTVPKMAQPRACLLLYASVVVCLYHFISDNLHGGPWLDECLMCIWVPLWTVPVFCPFMNVWLFRISVFRSH